MSEWWAVTARRRLELMPRVLCAFATEEEARAEHDKLVREHRRDGLGWKFGLCGYVEHPIPASWYSKPRAAVMHH